MPLLAPVTTTTSATLFPFQPSRHNSEDPTPRSREYLLDGRQTQHPLGVSAIGVTVKETLLLMGTFGTAQIDNSVAKWCWDRYRSSVQT